ncbi:MAG: SAVED domain-containing protein [Deltaproteobacteria bacterium]|nr:SAVED domain-containing protein [Deltaproteobacteria bacterium]
MNGPEHADALVEQIVHELARLRTGRVDTLIHLFVSAPAAVVFMLGQHRDALGRLRLHEVEFSQSADPGYCPTIDLPFPLGASPSA